MCGHGPDTKQQAGPDPQLHCVHAAGAHGWPHISRPGGRHRRHQQVTLSHRFRLHGKWQPFLSIPLLVALALPIDCATVLLSDVFA